MAKTLRPATVKYECIGCGDCCRMPWVIPLRPEEAEFLNSLEWAGDLEELNQAEKTVETKDVKGRKFHRLAKKKNDTACVFLGADNLCMIHQEFGESSKPAACKQFPRTRLSLDGQPVEHYSLLCKCVELLPDATEVFQVGESTSEVDAFPEQFEPKNINIKFRERQTLKWIPFQDIWSDILSFFEQDDLDVTQAIRCSWKYLTMIFEGDPNLETGKMMRDAFRDSLPNRIKEIPFENRMDATQRSLFFQLMFYAINPAPYDFYEKSIVEQARIREARQKQGEAFRDETGSPFLANEILDCTFASVRETVFPNGDGEDAVLLKKLLKAFLITKGAGLRFHQESDDQALSSIHMLLLSLPQSIWLAKALASHESRTEVNADDLMKAIRTIDSSIGNVDSTMFSGKMSEAWNFLFTETDFAAAATSEFVN